MKNKLEKVGYHLQKYLLYILITRNALPKKKNCWGKHFWSRKKSTKNIGHACHIFVEFVIVKLGKKLSVTRTFYCVFKNHCITHLPISLRSNTIFLNSNAYRVERINLIMTHIFWALSGLVFSFKFYLYWDWEEKNWDFWDCISSNISSSYVYFQISKYYCHLRNFSHIARIDLYFT